MAGVKTRSKKYLDKIFGKKPIPFNEISEEELNGMNKSQLQQLLSRLRLPKSGTVPELRNRLLSHLAVDEVRTEEIRQPDQVNQPRVQGAEQKPPDHVKTEQKAPIEAPEPSTASKKRKKWGTTDPLEIPPNYYHRDLFVVNFPLVDFVKVPPGIPFPVPDKFEGPVLDEKETFQARKKWVCQLCEVTRAYKAPENEQQSFPWHFALIESLKCFTRPSRLEVLKQNECTCKKRKWCFDPEESGITKRAKTEIEGEDYETEDCTGLVIESQVEEDVQGPLGRGGPSSDNAGLEITPEETAELDGDLQEDDDVPTGFADEVLHVHDELPLMKQKLEGGGGGLIDPDRVAGILERKFKEDKSKNRAPFQGGFYGAKHAMLNIQKGHGTPVYVLVMTSHMWTYGQIVPEGYVQLRDGQVDPASMVQFSRHQHITGKRQSDFETLEAKLAAGTTFYRKNYKDGPVAAYRDGPMLVGTYYLSSEWFPLPGAESGTAKSAGVRRLFDGLMRLIAGDSVLKMTAEGYNKRFQVWDEMMDELAEDALN